MNTRSQEINWIPAIFLCIYQPLLLLSLPFYFYFAAPTWGMVVASVILLYLTGLSITAGYHRYYSHKAYKAHPIVEFFLLFFSSASIQGSALRWSYDHRIHHAYVDTDQDPYSIKKGFWFAHCLWILKKPLPIKESVVSDLLKNRMVMFQHRHILKLMIGTNILIFLFTGWLLNDYLGALVLATFTRMFCLHHFTWFINSLAHTWGDKPFCQEQSAVDNYIISLLTFGEGYHNYHHTFANDYRNGVKWYHFEPTKWLIWSLSKIGLVHGLKRVDPETIKKRIVAERKNLLLENIKKYWSDAKDDLEVSINELTDRITDRIAKFHHLKKEYKQIKSNLIDYSMLKQLRGEIKVIKKGIKKDWKELRHLTNRILSGPRLYKLSL